MVMQMLAAGGLPVLSDGLRATDEDNPLGYFEYEPVKHLHENSDWMKGARGRAIKVVAPLLPYLPKDQDFCIIFIERDADEILASQLRMLERRGAKAADSPDRRARLKEAFTHQVHNLKWTLCRRPRTRVHFLNHADTLRDPRAAAEAIRAFLAAPLDTTAMAAQVKPALHRQRTNSELSTSLRSDSP
jgi:hypothetical protein